MSNVNGCCDDNSPTVLPSPKEEMRKRKAARMPVLFELENPIPQEVADSKELSETIEKYKLVPYAGHTNGSGHSTLAWYLMLSKLSPTNGAVIDKLTKYAVGGRAVFVRSENPDYDIGEETQPLKLKEKTDYQEAITEFIEFEGGVRNYHRLITASLKATGNAWVEMSVMTVNGQTRIHLRNQRQTQTMYMRTKADEIRMAAISPIWTDEYLRKNPPRMIPLYPNFTVENGAKKTLFHLKNGDNNWYGRPDSQSADLYKYREVQDAIYIVKQAANNFTGQIVFEVEDDGQDPAINENQAWESGFDSFADRMTENFTQRGKEPLSVFVTSRPFGAKPMFVFQVAPNTNEKWYKETGAMSESYILGAHGATLRFMGKDAANGFSTDAFVSDYVMNMEPVINDLRTTVMVFSNSILSVAWEALGMQQMNEISLSFQTPIQSAIDEYKSVSEKKEAQQQQTPRIETV